MSEKAQLNRWLSMRLGITEEIRTIFYDHLPTTKLLWIALRSKTLSLKIEFDYDRTGWSKTGFVYRLIRTGNLSVFDFDNVRKSTT